MRYLGIDFGLKKLGLALGDSETRIASPIETIAHTEDVLDRLAELVRKEGVGEVVIGMPMSAGEFHTSEQLEITQKFAKALRSKIGVLVHEEDERYTSAEGRRLQKEYGAQASEDSLAAMLILQSYLDTLK